ncbi:hypothetical protein N9V88_00385 [bacterium]|nr:hypothetical protein [bacterium]
MVKYQEPEWVVRICRPAFQDFQRLLPRYYARSELNRQLLKLRWWNPKEPFVIDLAWNQVPDTDLYELVIEKGFEFATGLRIVFFEHSPRDAVSPSIWILGGIKICEEFDEINKMIYVGRSLIVRERATE